MLDKLLGLARRDQRPDSPQAVLHCCARLLDEPGEAQAIAVEVITGYWRLSPPERHDFLLALNADFAPDPQALLAHAQAYARSGAAPDLVGLAAALQSPRQQVFKRLSRAPGGMAAIVAMRECLLSRLGEHPELQALNMELLGLLENLFNPGLLQLRRVDWSSPAALLEKLIVQQAVHAVDGWSDLRRRLQADRRCFAFFHPALPDEPLIFVEVALLHEMPQALAPLLDRRKGAAPLNTPFTVAAFYSISHCLPGLHGVHLGHFLIRQVVQQLQAEMPSLQTFCTLSLVPGFAQWLQRTRRIDTAGLKPALLDSLNQDLLALRNRHGRDLAGLIRRDAAPGGHRMVAGTGAAMPAGDDASLSKDGPRRRRDDLAGGELTGAVSPDAQRNPGPDGSADAQAAEYHQLSRLCAHYLTRAMSDQGHHPDPVARFHLRNGARLDRINPWADRSGHAMARSFGLMVNYVYNLDDIESNHRAFMRAEVACGRQIQQLLRRA